MSALTPLVLLLLLHNCLSSEDLKECRMVSGKPGLCVPIRRCSALVELINNLQKPLPQDVGLLLRESFFCGAKDGSVLTCCPREGVLHGGQVRAGQMVDKGRCQLQYDGPASCVPYTQCDPFSMMLTNLRKPFPLAVPLIMKEVYACGKHINDLGNSVPKVCCPNAALTPKEIEDANRFGSHPPPPPPSPSPAPTTPAPPPSHGYEDHPGYKNIASPGTCGRALVLERIVGGQNAELGQYPWLVNLGYTLGSSKRPDFNPPKPDSLEATKDNNFTKALQPKFNCGGTLIGPRIILTAAHCVVGLPTSYKFSVVRVGEYDLSKDRDCFDFPPDDCADEVQDFTDFEVIGHPDYNRPKRYQNDIAIIKLKQEVAINDFVEPICLPFSNQFNKEPSPPLLVDVAGWGATDMFARKFPDVLQFVQVPIHDHGLCQEIFERQRVTIGEDQICAGGISGKDSCAGDSGSALMMEAHPTAYDPRFVQIGVVSFGARRCASKGVPAVYARVSNYLQWILDSTL